MRQKSVSRRFRRGLYGGRKKRERPFLPRYGLEACNKLRPVHPNVVKNHNVSPVVHMDIQLIIVCHFVRRVAFIRRKTFIVVTTVNHSEDKEPVIYWGGDKYPCCRIARRKAHILWYRYGSHLCNKVSDYGWKEWAGLIDGFYLPRWKMF